MKDRMGEWTVRLAVQSGWFKGKRETGRKLARTLSDSKRTRTLRVGEVMMHGKSKIPFKGDNGNGIS